MKITIELCKQTSKQLEQYLSQRNTQRANLADEFEREGNDLVAADLRKPTSAEVFITGLVLRVLDEREVKSMPLPSPDLSEFTTPELIEELRGREDLERAMDELTIDQIFDYLVFRETERK